MKTPLLVSVIVAGLLSNFAGCANQPASSTTAANTEPTKHTVTQKDLSRSTRTQPAEQLSAADPSITTSSGR